MPLEEYDAEINLLLNELEGDLGDSHEILERIRQLVARLEAQGLEPPADLQGFIKQLESQWPEPLG